MTWDGISVPMKEHNATKPDNFSANAEPDIQRIQRILDAKYEKADLSKVVTDCTHLSEEECTKLYELLVKYKPLFDGSLGKCNGEPYHIELKPGVEPYHARA